MQQIFSLNTNDLHIFLRKVQEIHVLQAFQAYFCMLIKKVFYIFQVIKSRIW